MGPPEPPVPEEIARLQQRSAERSYGPPQPPPETAEQRFAATYVPSLDTGTDFRSRSSVTGREGPTYEQIASAEQAGYRAPAPRRPFNLRAALDAPPMPQGMARVKEDARAAGRVLTGMAADVAVALPSVAAGLAPDAIRYRGANTTAGKQAEAERLQGELQGAHQAIQDIIPPPDKAFTPPPEMGLVEGVTSAVGYGVPVAAGAKAAGLAGKGITKLTALTGATQGLGQNFFEASAAGAPLHKAFEFGLVGAITGASEAIGGAEVALPRALAGDIGKLAKYLAGADNATMGGIRKAMLATLAGGTEEAVQNSLQGLGNELGRAIYKEPEEVLNGWVEQFKSDAAMGGFVGALVTGAVQTALGIKKALGERSAARAQEAEAEALQGPTPQQELPQEPTAPAVTAPLSEASRAHMAEARKAATSLDVVGTIPADEQLVEVEPSRPDQVFAREWLNQRGTKAVFVQDTGGSALPFRGVTIGDTVYFDANMAPEEVRRQTVYHEGVHTLDGEVRIGLIGSIRSADPEGFARIQSAHPKAFDPNLSAEEATAEQAEAIVSWIDEAYSSPERIAQIAEYNPGIFRRFLNHMKRVLRRMGFKNLSTDLEQMLGADLKADDPKAAAQMALAFKQAFDTMLARETVTQAPGVARPQAATPVVASLQAPAVTQAPVETVKLPSTETGQAQAPAEPSKPPKKRGGRQGELVLPSGKALPVTYRVVDAREIVPSHDPTKGYARNEGGDINEREYGHPVEGRAYRDTVERIALAVRPGLVLSDTPSASDGPPIVGPGLRVLGGNARSMGLQLAYDKGGDGAARLREATLDAAERFGIDPEELAGIERPVLVRELSEKDAGAPGEMSRVLNQPLTTAKTANTEAVSRGSKIDADAAAEIGEIIGDGTLREAMGDAVSTGKLLRVLVGTGAFTDADITALMNQSGLLTQSGRDIVEQTLMGSVVTNLATLSELPPAIRQMLLKSLPNLIRTRVAWPEFGGIVQNALEAVIAARASNGSLRKARSQSQMIGEVAWKTDEQAIALAERMLSDNQTEFARRIFVLVEGITDAQRGQAGFFDAPKRKLSKPEAFQEAVTLTGLKGEPGVPARDGDGPQAGEGARAEEVGPRFAAAYHGSPHDFDKFTTEKIGTGEGAQAYGWGMYFAGKREIAEHYKRTLSNPARTIEDKARDLYDKGDDPAEAVSALLAHPSLAPHERELLLALQRDDWLGFDYPHQAVRAIMSSKPGNFDASPETLEAAKRAREQAGRLYQVDLAPAEDEYLLWDKPLSEQSDIVRSGIDRIPTVVDDTSLLEDGDDTSGKQLYKSLSETIGGEDMDASKTLRSLGIRGIKYLDASSRSEGEGSYNYVIFDDADVRIEAKFARALRKLTPAQQSNIPERTRAVALIENLAERMELFHRTMKALGEDSVVLSEKLMYGIIEVKKDYAVNNFFRPIERTAKRHNIPLNVSEAGPDGAISVDDFRRYLAATHVNHAFNTTEHRDPNTGATVKYGTQTNPASGKDSLGKDITNDYAVKQINRAMRQNGPVYNLIAERVAALNEWKLDEIVASGRQTPEWKDAVKAKWGDHWSPAAEDADLSPSQWSTGLSLSVKGPAYKPKKGRRTVGGSPMVLSAQDMAHQVVLNARNVVAQEIGDAVKRHPEIGDVRLVDEQATAALNRINELTSYTVMFPNDPQVPAWEKERAQLWERTMGRPYKSTELWFFYREAGKNRAIEFANDDLARSLKGMDIEQVGAAMQLLGLYTKFHRKTIIDWNPFFAIGNLPRDVQTALANVYLMHGGKLAKAVAKQIPAAAIVVHDYQFAQGSNAHGATHAKVQQKYAKEIRYLHEMIDAGGSIQRVDFEDVKKSLTDLRQMNLAGRGIGALADMTPQALHKAAESVGHLIAASEQASRLAAYIAAREAGMPVREAAVLAREATVDWARKGNWNSWMSTFFTFAPASIKGSNTTIRVIRNAWATQHGRRRVLKLGASMYSFGFAMSVLSRMFAPDEYDTENDWTKATRAGVWLGRYTVGIPLAWGYNVFFYAGMLSADIFFGDETPISAAMKLASASKDAFSPVSGPDTGYASTVEDMMASLVAALSPDIIRPVTEAAINKTYTGAPVHPETYDDATPAHTVYWSSTSRPARMAATFASELTGGSDNVKGDVEVSPSTLQHLYRSYSGQLGTNLERIFGLAVSGFEGDGTSVNEVPGVNRFIREAGPANWSRAYYEAKAEIAQAKGSVTDKRADVDDKRLARLEDDAKLFDKDIAELRKRRDAAKDGRARRELDRKIADKQRKLIRLVRKARTGTK